MNTDDAREQAKAKRAKAIQMLRKCGMTDDEIAKELGLESLGGLQAKDQEREQNSTVDRLPAKIEHVGSHDDSNIIDVEVVDLSSPEPMDMGAGVREPSTRIEENSSYDADTVANQQNSIGIAKWSEEWWANVKPETRAHRCKAIRKNGQRCLKAAIDGAVVCRTHGGAAPQVKKRARARLENAADLMAQKLLGIAIDEKTPVTVRLKAIRDALDRAGLKPTTEIAVSAGQSAPYEDVFSDVFTGTRAESRRARGMELGTNDIAALGYSGDTQSEASRATVIDADGYEVTDSNPENEGAQQFSPNTDIPVMPNRPGGGIDARYGGVGPNSYGDYDRLSGPQSDRTGSRVQSARPARHITGEDAIRLAREQRAITAGD